MKRCSKCEIEKKLEFFAKHSSCKQGVASQCKECKNKHSSDPIRKLNKAEYDNKRQKTDRVKDIRYVQRSLDSAKEKKVLYDKERRSRDDIKSHRNIVERLRYKNDEFYAFKCSMRSHAHRIDKMNHTTSEVLGYSFSEAYNIIKSRDYSEGCENINVDHIVPLSWSENKVEALRLSHISNLQYLSFAENQKKKANIYPKYYTTEVLELYCDIIYRQILKRYGE
tara:strand:- start:12017 stop:12688 length:672 start_codon:yes stop_codon:yes gene_type:complete